MLVAFFVLAFFAAGLADFLETRYVRAVGDRRSTLAAFYSIAMMLVGSFCVYAFVEVSPMIVVPEALGMFIGTKLAMR